MWERVKQFELETSLAAVTTSVWQYADVVAIGVMRPVMLAPPILWAVRLTAGLRELRHGKELLDEFQLKINAPLVYAEAEVSKPRNLALLNYLGFICQLTENNRSLYYRSI